MPYRRIGFSDRLSTAVKDVAGNLADPGTLVLKIKDPANVVTTHNWTGDITRDAQGQFHYDLASLTTLGRYSYKWNSTGANTGVSPNLTYFTLVDEWTPLLLTLEGARSQVNQNVTDADLELYVDSAVEEMEKELGPIIPAVKTREATVFSGGKLLLPHSWLVSGSITAATQNGVAVSTTGWTFNAEDGSGIVTIPSPAFIYGTVTVTYTAGFDPIPSPLREAAAELAQSSYETQRGPGEGPFAEQVEGGGSAFLLRRRAEDKMRYYRRVAVA